MVVVGGGAAGLSGAKILARFARSVLLVDAGAPRNGPAEGVHNYLYAEGATPAELSATGRSEAAGYGVRIVDGTARSARVLGDPAPGAAAFTVTVGAGPDGERTVGARRLLLATGLVDVLPDVPGVREGWGHDVLHCPYCHGWEVRDRAIGVLATSPMAVHTATMFRQLSRDVVLFAHTAPDLDADQRERLAALDVEVVTGEVAALDRTAGALSGVRLADGRVLPREAVAVTTTLLAREDLLSDLGLSREEVTVAGTAIGRQLAVDAAGATATPGVWAAGNVASPMAQVVNSAAAGAAAGAAVNADLIAEDIGIAVRAHRARVGRE